MYININNYFVYCILIISILLAILGIFFFIAFIYHTKLKFHTYNTYISTIHHNNEDIKIQEIHDRFLEDLGFKKKWIKKIILSILHKKKIKR